MHDRGKIKGSIVQRLTSHKLNANIHTQQTISLDSLPVSPTAPGGHMPNGKEQELTDKPGIIPITAILEYKAAGLTLDEIGQLVGCTKQNISARLKAYKADFKGLETFKNKRADILALFQQKLLYSLTAADIKAMPAGSRILGMCQLYDKERLERGKPGQIIEYNDIQAELADTDAEIAELERQLAEISG